MGGIPTIYEFLAYLNFLRGTPAAILVLLTASLILILPDWRWLLLALILQYLVAGLLFADVLPPHLAFMKVLVCPFWSIWPAGRLWLLVIAAAIRK